MCLVWLAENTGCKNYAKNKNRHLHTIAQLCWAVSLQLRQVSTIGKNLLIGNIFSICLYTMVNFGPLTSEICWRVWSSPANFNGFRVLASLLHRHHSTEVNQTLHYCILLNWQHCCMALEHWHQQKFAAWYKEWNYGTFAEGAIYIRQGGCHVGHRPTF